jgi:hypothetical protein
VARVGGVVHADVERGGGLHRVGGVLGVTTSGGDCGCRGQRSLA